jgi:hypothetical protein
MKCNKCNKNITFIDKILSIFYCYTHGWRPLTNSWWYWKDIKHLDKGKIYEHIWC